MANTDLSSTVANIVTEALVQASSTAASSISTNVPVLTSFTLDPTWNSAQTTLAPARALEPALPPAAATEERLLYSHILEAVARDPWALLPVKMHAVLELLAMRAAGHRLSADQVQERIGAVRRASGSRSQGAVAVLPLIGTLIPRASMLAETSGVQGLAQWTVELNRFVDDPQVGSIVLDVDSPGGSVFGTQEAAAAVDAARSKKPIVAVANHMAASAAYWIASQADEIVITPSGEVGSIGVIAAHEDLSAALEREGIKVTLITAGKYKAEGNPLGPLGADALEHMQSRVDDYYKAFTAAVGRGRGVSATAVREGFGQGRMVAAQRAVKLGMADRVDTLDATIARLVSGELPPRAGRPRADVSDASPLLALFECRSERWHTNAYRFYGSQATVTCSMCGSRVERVVAAPSLDLRRRRMRRRAS